MPYATAHLLADLKAARAERKLSQRELAGQTGLTQSHLSKIENGLVDPQASTLVEIGRALGLELRWIPRKALPAVEGVVRSLSGPGRAGERPDASERPAYRLDDFDGE